MRKELRSERTTETETNRALASPRAPLVGVFIVKVNKFALERTPRIPPRQVLVRAEHNACPSKRERIYYRPIFPFV